MQKSVSIPVVALMNALLALSACHHRAAAPTGATATLPGLVVSQARLVLPAVPGHPGAAYFTLGNEGNAPATLVGVAIGGTQQAEMHETAGGAMKPLAQVRIDPGQRVIFAPAGKHVMAFGIPAQLTPGSNGTITFHFQDGKATTAPLRVEAPGGEASHMGSMAGMDMGGKR